MKHAWREDRDELVRVPVTYHLNRGRLASRGRHESGEEFGVDGSRPELTGEELVTLVEAGKRVHVLDVRAPERLAAGRVEVVPSEDFYNIRGSAVLSNASPSSLGIPQNGTLAVVCGHGNDSRKVAQHLGTHGYDSRSLTGGMVGWMALSIRRELPSPVGWDRFVQMDRIGKGALAYILISDGEALVVDPPRDLAPITKFLEAEGARLVGTADTHAHADYISGGSSLAKHYGVPYYLHAADAVYPFDGTPARVPFRAIADGDEITVGRRMITVVHTPGHTEGSVSYRLDENAVLTGDFVFIRSVGRPDLGGQAEVWTQSLWQSLERVRSEWSDSMAIYPAHYSSAKERTAGGSVGQTWDEVRRQNDPLRIAKQEDFTAWVLERVGGSPAAYSRIKAINLGLESPTDEEMIALEAGRNQCALG